MHSDALHVPTSLVLARAISSLQISYSSLSFWLYLSGQCQFARTKAINDITSIIVCIADSSGILQVLHSQCTLLLELKRAPFNTAVTVIAHPPSRWLISQFYHRHCHLKLQMIILMMISKQRKGEEKALLVTCNMHNGVKSFLRKQSNFLIFTRSNVNFVSKKCKKTKEVHIS